MRYKRTVLTAAAAALLVGAGGVGAQLSRGNPDVPRPDGSFSAAWVKIDKTPATPDTRRIYCVAYSGGGVSCDWSDVRTVGTYYISR